MNVLLAVVSGFASGVFLRSVFIFNWPPIVFVLVLAAIFAGAFVARGHPISTATVDIGCPRTRAYAIGAVFFIFTALGMVRMMVADTPLPAHFASEIKHRVSYEGIVVADPDVRDANQRVEVRVSTATEKGLTKSLNSDPGMFGLRKSHFGESTNVLVVAPRTTTVAVGDTVRVSGTLALPEPFDDNGRISRYDKYLERDGIRFLLNYSSIRALAPAPWYSISAALARVKHAFLNGLTAVLPEPYASLAGGVVIGGKSGLGTELQDAFTRSGLVQIVVLSGYNVMVVAQWLMAALAFTKLSRRWRAGAGAFAILIFVGIAGFSATALRAMLMALIALYARATGRTYAAGRALLATIFLMLLWNPLYLAFDPGFALSVAATAGLIWLAPIIEIALKRQAVRLRTLSVRILGTLSVRNSLASEKAPPEVSGFWTNALATTLAAQVAVLPLLLYFTGNLSFVAIPANLITMPIVPLTMALSALAGFAGMIFAHLAPIIGITLALPAYATNAYLILVARSSAALPFAAFAIPAFPFFFVPFAYTVLIAIASSKRFSTTGQLIFLKNASR